MLRVKYLTRNIVAGQIFDPQHCCGSLLLVLPIASYTCDLHHPYGSDAGLLAARDAVASCCMPDAFITMNTRLTIYRRLHGDLPRTHK